MKNGDKFLGMFGVLNTSLTCAIFLIWGLGFFGYYKFGEDVKPSLTYNLEATDL